MEVLRVAHSPHEHGKDVIAIDKRGGIHAYQLKDGDLDLKDFERNMGQITALVETQIEHPSISGHPRHQPWLVISGQSSIPVEDRIRVHNLQWRKRRYTPLKLLAGRQLLAKFTKMSADFWPQNPEDSHRLFQLYLADGNGSLDRDAFAKLIASICLDNGPSKKTDVVRKLSAGNLFASYGLSPFYRSQNHWELIQGWTITAAHIARGAETGKLPKAIWRPVFRLAVEAALRSLDALAGQALEDHALRPGTFCELDEITRSRCTICAGAIATKVLVTRHNAKQWDQEALAKKKLENLFLNKRLTVWGESAVPFFLAQMWSLEKLRGDQFSDAILFAVLSALVQNSLGRDTPKLSWPYDSADETHAQAFRRFFNIEETTEVKTAASYTLESLVAIVARRLWRNELARFWSPITKIDFVRLTSDTPTDIFLWRWGNERGANQLRKFPPKQSWCELLAESRRHEDNMLPEAIKNEFDFALLFLLCFPHRLSRALVKHLDDRMALF